MTGAGGGGRRAADASGSEDLLHRRLVAAEERRSGRDPRDAARLPHMRRGHHMGLDHRLETIDLEMLLQPADDFL